MLFPWLPWGHSMKLDSEDQRQTILNCIQNAVVSGSVGELMPLMTKLADLANVVQSAEIESSEQPIPQSGGN
jgi:hypothetical protein